MMDERRRQSADQFHRVVFFGDSICVGQGVSLPHGWVSQVAARIDAQRTPASNLIVVNASVNGDTTRLALERMPYDVQSHGVSLLIVQFGMNDCNYWLTDYGVPRVSLKAFAANLEEIITRGLLFGARKVFLNTNHPTLRDREMFPRTTTTYEASNRLYNTVIREVAGSFESNVVLNDVEAAFDGVTGGDRDRLAPLLLDDDLHLSIGGHEIYFNLIMPRLSNAMRSELPVSILHRSHEPRSAPQSHSNR